MALLGDGLLTSENPIWRRQRRLIAPSLSRRHIERYAETMAGVIEQLNINHVFLRDPSQASPVVIKLNTARLKGTLAGMEALLGDQEYLLPSGFSAADTMMGFNLFAAPYFVKLDAFPRLAAYKARIEARPAFRRAAARDGVQTFYDRDFYPVPGPVDKNVDKLKG